VTVLGERAAQRLGGIPIYQPGRPVHGVAVGKLSSNEAPVGASPAVTAAVATAARSLHRYPDAEPQVLDLLSATVGLTTDHLLLTNGSDELCSLIAGAFLGPGHSAVVGKPAYQIDKSVTLASGAELIEVPLIDGGHDLDAMAAAAQRASVVWLPSPHNPTGIAVDPRRLDDFVAAVPSQCLVVLDEAYRSFAEPAYQPDIGGLLSRYPNVLVQRTMSKEWGLAGLRIGYALAAPDIIAGLQRLRAPFSVNTLALAAAKAALTATAWRDMSVALVRFERAKLHADLARNNVEYYPSQANFVCAHIDYAGIAPALDEAGLAIRPGEDLGLPGWVRISLGWAPSMAALRAVLRRRATQ